jgi:rubrerythrin
MEEYKVRRMLELANKLQKFEIALRLKCEICGPILRGDNPNRYPKCKKHIDK